MISLFSTNICWILGSYSNNSIPDFGEYMILKPSSFDFVLIIEELHFSEGILVADDNFQTQK